MSNKKDRSLQALQIEGAYIQRQKRLNGYEQTLQKLAQGENVDKNAILRAWQRDRARIFEQYTEKVHWLYNQLFEAENNNGSKTK